MEIYLKRRIRIPTVPSFILTEGDEDKTSIPVKSLSKTEIEEIAEEWTKALLKKAGY